MTIQTSTTLMNSYITYRQLNMDLLSTAWATYSNFFDQGVVQDVAAKKIILTVLTGADADILDDITTLIASINGVV